MDKQKTLTKRIKMVYILYAQFDIGEEYRHEREYAFSRLKDAIHEMQKMKNKEIERIIAVR